MEVEVSGSETSAIEEDVRGERGREQLLDKRRALVAALEQCQRALELIRNTDDEDAGVEEEKDEEETDEDSSSECGDSEMAQLCDLLKSRVESINFLEKIENIQASVSQNSAEEASSWDMVSENDLWEGGNMDDDIESGPEGYVLVRQEDILEGVACFMATFLLSLDQTKDFTPNQLQEVLSKTFSVKKKKGKLQKAWNGSKVIYNAASWGATAIGIYQNPALFSAASVAFGTSCRVISRFF